MVPGLQLLLLGHHRLRGLEVGLMVVITSMPIISTMYVVATEVELTLITREDMGKCCGM